MGKINPCLNSTTDKIADIDRIVSFYYASGALLFKGEVNDVETLEVGEIYYDVDYGLIYNGEYSSSLNIGGDIYYESGTLKFKGEFSVFEVEIITNTERGNLWGLGYEMGTSFYESGVIEYIGNWKFYDFQGVGKEYYETGVLKYDGEYSNSEYQGNGKLYYPSGTLQYDGGWVEGEYCGSGKAYYESGILHYYGYWEGDELYCSDGKEYNEFGMLLYYGGFSADEHDGQGKLYHESGQIKYDGGWDEGIMCGCGKSYYDTGILDYDGEWDEGKYNGQGKKYYETGQIKYEGEFKYNAFNGVGKYYNDSGMLKYDGSFLDGKLNGLGKYYDDSGQLVLEGFFIQGVLSGHGKHYYDKEIVYYDGEFKEGKYHGRGRTYKPTGELIGEFLFENGVQTISMTEKFKDHSQLIKANKVETVQKRKRIIIFDTETTGFKPGSICQLSYVILDDLNVIKAKNYYFKVDNISFGAQNVHGLSIEKLIKLSGNRTFIDYFKEIRDDFEATNTVVAHNIEFDMSFLNAEFNRCNYTFSSPKQFCTMKHFTPICKLSENASGNYKWPKLEEVMTHFKIDTSILTGKIEEVYGTEGIGYHDARADVTATYLCFKRAVETGLITLNKI